MELSLGVQVRGLSLDVGMRGLCGSERKVVTGCGDERRTVAYTGC